MSDPNFGFEIAARIDELAKLSDERGCITRLYLSRAHRRAVALIADWMRDAGMATHVDAAGTLVGRYEGRAPGAPAPLFGSHIDTVRDAGPFDGGTGVLIAIAVVARMNRVAKRFAFAIEIIAFGDSEGVRFASTLGGSRALAGIVNPNSLDERDSEGVTRREALVAFGCDPERIGEAARAADDALGYVEVYIEQGPVLEAADAPLGLFTAICGTSHGAVRVRGESGHEGGVPMAMRRDALAASAEMLLAIERRATAEPHLVATVERLEVSNADVNTIPGEANFTIDVRAPSDSSRKDALADLSLIHI